MSTPEAANKALVHRLFEQAVSGGDLSVIDECVAPHAQWFQHTRPEPYVGPEGFKEYVTAVRTGIPDARLDVHETLAEGNTVMSHWTLRGTQTGTFFGIPPLGETVAMEALELIRLEDGKVVEIRLMMDGMNMARQLGVMSGSGKLPAPFVAILKLRSAARRGRLALQRTR